MVRIPTSHLQELVLEHWSSNLDASPAQAAARILTGSTLWTTRPGATRIEVGWRWAELRDAIVILDPQRIETNVQLLGPTGREEPRTRALIHLFEYVETLPWRTPIQRLLGRSRH